MNPTDDRTPDEPAIPPSPAPGAPQRQAQRFPTWKQALLMLGGGILLAATACFGFLVSLGGNFERGGDAVWSPITAILFFIGLLVALAGLVLSIVRLFSGKRT
jgi:hypothetical protein